MLPDHTTTLVKTATTVQFTTETPYLTNFPTTTETLERTQLQTTSADVTTQSSSTLNQGIKVVSLSRLTPPQFCA
jgi:hypothetical protein